MELVPMPMISLEEGTHQSIGTPHFPDGRVALIGRHTSPPELRSVEK